MAWLIALYCLAVVATGFWAELENVIAAEVRAFEVHQHAHTEAMRGRSLAGKPVLVVYDSQQRHRRISGLVTARFGVFRPLVRFYVKRRAL